jgi:hypothetical protein
VHPGLSGQWTSRPDWHSAQLPRRTLQRQSSLPRDHAPVSVPLETLRPTQMAVGMRTVTTKRRKLETRACKRKQLEKLLLTRPIPAVKGPDGDLYIIDHHHFGLALWQAEIDYAFAQIIDDLSTLSYGAFWRRMESDGRLYPFDEDGRRVSPQRLPPELAALRHDPFRDLASDVKAAGGYRKVATPYAEFHWANFFRRHIASTLIRNDRRQSLRQALKLCRSPEARGLPGYIAPAAGK